MKINAKDLASGILLLVLAGLGLWLNLDHTLGNSRRMGPGYMPMLVFWIEFGLGAIVLLMALFSSPDPLEKWLKLDFVTLAAAIVVGLVGYQVIARIPALEGNWYPLGIALTIALLILAVSPGWRVLGLVLAGMTIFGVLLDAGGLFLAIAAMVIIAAFADKDHRPMGVAACVVFLIALCWWVFIYELDIRVNIWPTF
jgi:hypothetical protein